MNVHVLSWIFMANFDWVCTKKIRNFFFIQETFLANVALPSKKGKNMTILPKMFRRSCTTQNFLPWRFLEALSVGSYWLPKLSWSLWSLFNCFLFWSLIPLKITIRIHHKVTEIDPSLEQDANLAISYNTKLPFLRIPSLSSFCVCSLNRKGSQKNLYFFYSNSYLNLSAHLCYCGLIFGSYKN